MELVGHGVKTGEGDSDERELSPPQRGPGAPRGHNEQHTEYQVLGKMSCHVHDVGIGAENGGSKAHEPTLDRGQGAGAVEIAAGVGGHEKDHARPQGDDNPGEYEVGSLRHRR